MLQTTVLGVAAAEPHAAEGGFDLVAVLLIAGLQLTLFAMWFDMEANKDLR